ncbi:MAG: Rrf2 family transcriptional regulator, partial [Megasphaera elsdenii]|nr:Rrf2 family transcriptional regulator [Megasphaera elsdenii]
MYNTRYRRQGGRNMRLNQATDYAFRMVLYLASLPEGTKI